MPRKTISQSHSICAARMMTKNREAAKADDPFARCYDCVPGVLKFENELSNGNEVGRCGPGCKRRFIAAHDVDAEQVISESGRTFKLRLYRGAHLLVDRGAYLHHGIYCGDLKVVHYAGGLADAGPVVEVDLNTFAEGAALAIQEHPNAVYLGHEVVARARQRLTEDDYSIWNNNCEHFCEWAIEDHPRSRQIERIDALGILAKLGGQVLWGAVQIVFTRR